MSNGIDIYTILFAALALFLFFKLRSLLGTKNGEEGNFAPKPPAQGNDNVVPFPSQPSAAPAEFKFKGLCEEGSAVANGLSAISLREPTFNAHEFLTGAKAAYEMFTSAFAKGDVATLKAHLSPEVFVGFEQAVAQRMSLGHRQDFKFVGFDKAEIVAALIDEPNQEAEVTVAYKAQAISSTFDKDNRLVEGTPDRVTDMTDTWTFARKLNSKDPNWVLVGTEDGA